MQYRNKNKLLVIIDCCRQTN